MKMNDQKISICISTIVFGQYEKYIPFYVYSILKSYSDYFVKIFVVGTISDNIKKCMLIISNELSSNFEIVENYLIQLTNQFKKDTQLLKTYRWLIPKKEFQEFDYVYIGDIDFLIIKEDPSLLDFHLRHSKIICLPYSNIIRPKKKNQLSGLHFFCMQKYFEMMEGKINFYFTNPYCIKQIKKKSKKPFNNEEFLYWLIKEGIGFANIKQYPYRPHHGFHLGCLRNGILKPGYLEFGQFVQDILLPDFIKFKENLNSYFNDPIFTKILDILTLPEIICLRNNLEAFFSNRNLILRKFISLIIILYDKFFDSAVSIFNKKMRNNLIKPNEKQKNEFNHSNYKVNLMKLFYYSKNFLNKLYNYVLL